MKKEIFAIALTLFAANSSQAHELGTEISKPTRFERMAWVLEEGCKANKTQLDCDVQVFKAQFDTRDTANLARNIERSLNQNKYVESAFARLVDKNNPQQVEASFESIFEAAGVEFTEISELVLEAIDNDIYHESLVQLVDGDLTGSMSLSHEFLAFVDTENNEIIFFQAGYSE